MLWNPRRLMIVFARILDRIPRLRYLGGDETLRGGGPKMCCWNSDGGNAYKPDLESRIVMVLPIECCR